MQADKIMTVERITGDLTEVGCNRLLSWSWIEEHLKARRIGLGELDEKSCLARTLLRNRREWARQIQGMRANSASRDGRQREERVFPREASDEKMQGLQRPDGQASGLLEGRPWSSVETSLSRLALGGLVWIWQLKLDQDLNQGGSRCGFWDAKKNVAKLEWALSVRRDYVKGRECVLELGDESFLASKLKLHY